MQRTLPMRSFLAFVLVGGMLLSSACMLLVCPLIGVQPVAEEACHSVPGQQPEPVQCPYTVMQLVYAAPLPDLNPGQDPDHADAAPAAAIETAETGRWAGVSGEDAGVAAPPGTPLYVRLRVFRI